MRTVFDHEITSVDTPEAFFCNNNYYTTAANRLSRQQYENAVTCEDVVELCRINRRKPKEGEACGERNSVKKNLGSGYRRKFVGEHPALQI